MEELIGSYMVYTLIFRLAIVAAGVVAIVLGYKLFVYSTTTSENKVEEFSASAIGVKFLLKGAGSGLIFSISGIALIAIVVVKTTPGFLIENISGLDEVLPISHSTISKLSVKSGNVKEPSNHLDARTCLLSGLDGIDSKSISNEKLIKEYKEEIQKCHAGSFDIILDSFNKMSGWYLGENKLEEAKVFSVLPVMWDPNNFNYLNDAASIHFNLGDLDKAYFYAKRSVDLNPNVPGHLKNLQKIERALNGS